MILCHFSWEFIVLRAEESPIHAEMVKLLLAIAPYLAGSVFAQFSKTPTLLSDRRWIASNQHVKRPANESVEWPYGPFKTKGRDIVNTHGEVITWAGVNWPMSGETMVPEGLEWASVDKILDDVASVGWNFVRM